MSDYLTLVMEKDLEKTNAQGEFKFRNQNPGAYSVIMMRSKRSFVWNHYTIEKTEDGSEKAVCKYCNTMIKFKNGATSGLINHLKNMHQLMRDSNGQVSNDSDQPEDTSESSKKSRVTRQYEDLALPTKSKNGATYMKLGRLFSGVGDRVAFDEVEDSGSSYSDKNFTAYLVRFILRNGLSFDIVKSKDFINLVKHLNPEAVVPSHESLLKELEFCFPLSNS